MSKRPATRRYIAIEAIAEYVRMFDRKVNHPWRLSDVILCKFNSSKRGKPRLNPFYPHARREAKKHKFWSLP